MDRRASWRTKSAEAADLLELTLQRTRNSGHDSSSFTLSLASLTGLRREQLAGPPSDVRFTLARDAGTLSFEGRFDQGEGVGRYGFTSSPDFAAALRKLGYGGLDDEKLYSLALHDVSRAFIADLDALGYEKVPLDDLVNLRIHGASPAFIHELAALGMPHLPVDDLVNLRIHGATPDFIRELKALGYERVPLDDLVNMRIHGVTADFIRGLQGQGMRGASVGQLVDMKTHGR